MGLIQLPATPRHHPSETAQNRSNHDQHENNTRGKTETDPINASVAGHTGRFFTAFTSHYRRCVRQDRTNQRSEDEPHTAKLCYFERSCNR